MNNNTRSPENIRNILILFAFLCAVAAVVSGSVFTEEGNAGAAIMVPFLLLGKGLRWLSLAGIAGNILSWILYVILGLLPLAYPLGRRFRKDGNSEERILAGDVFCVLASVWWFFLLFLLINPAMVMIIFNPNPEFLDIVQASLLLILAGLICFAVILYSIHAAAEKNLLPLIRQMVIILVFIGIFSICYLILGNCVVNINMLLAAAPDGGALWDVEPTAGATIMDPFVVGLASAQEVPTFLLISEYSLAAIPILYLLGISIPVLRLLESMKLQFFSRENAALADTIGHRAKTALFLCIGCNLTSNLLQLLLARQATEMNIRVSIPIAELLFAFTMMFFAQYFSKTASLREENEQFV